MSTISQRVVRRVRRRWTYDSISDRFFNYLKWVSKRLGRASLRGCMTAGRDTSTLRFYGGSQECDTRGAEGEARLTRTASWISLGFWEAPAVTLEKLARTAC